MLENQVFNQTVRPTLKTSQIYPKTDWFWYYMNSDWIERKILLSVNWGDIWWDILDQTDLITLINDSWLQLPVDYIWPTETKIIPQYANYIIANPLVNDWIIVNDWTICIL